MLNWTDVSEKHCVYSVARVDLGNGIDASFQMWPDFEWHNKTEFKPLNARMEPNAAFWREYDQLAAAHGWDRIDPWHIVLQEKCMEVLERFYAVVEQELDARISKTERAFMEKTKGGGVLHFPELEADPFPLHPAVRK